MQQNQQTRELRRTSETWSTQAGEQPDQCVGERSLSWKPKSSESQYPCFNLE